MNYGGASFSAFANFRRLPVHDSFVIRDFVILAASALVRVLFF